MAPDGIVGPEDFDHIMVIVATECALVALAVAALALIGVMLYRFFTADRDMPPWDRIV